MKLAAHSEASYLRKPKTRSQAGGHFLLSNDATIPQKNGAVLNIAPLIKHVITSATADELADLYMMAREAVYIRIILEEMGHKQPPTPLQTENPIADVVVNSKVQPERKKPWTCDFIGLETENARISSGYIGGQENKNTQIIGQSTTQLRIIR